MLVKLSPTQSQYGSNWLRKVYSEVSEMPVVRGVRSLKGRLRSRRKKSPSRLLSFNLPKLCLTACASAEYKLWAHQKFSALLTTCNRGRGI